MATSTSQIAPATWLACGDSRNVTVEAMSRAAPTHPSGWKESKPASVWSIWSLGMKPSYSGVLTTAGATGLTRIFSAHGRHGRGDRVHGRPRPLRILARMKAKSGAVRYKDFEFITSEVGAGPLAPDRAQRARTARIR